jgi:hypothetical protein
MAAEMCRIIKKTPGKRFRKEKNVRKNELEMCTAW